MTRVVTEFAGRVSLKVSVALVTVPLRTGSSATEPVWWSCQTTADCWLPPFAWTLTRLADALVLTITISSGPVEANASTPDTTDVDETIVLPNLGKRP